LHHNNATYTIHQIFWHCKKFFYFVETAEYRRRGIERKIDIDIDIDTDTDIDIDTDIDTEIDTDTEINTDTEIKRKPAHKCVRAYR